MRSTTVLRRCGALVLAAGLALGLGASTAPDAAAAGSRVHTTWWNGPHALSDCIQSSQNFTQNGWRIVQSCYQVKSTNQYPTYQLRFVKG